MRIISNCDRCDKEDSINTISGLCPSCENEENQIRLEELEQIAKERYIENVDWDSVIAMLDTEELEEYCKIKGEYI